MPAQAPLKKYYAASDRIVQGWLDGAYKEQSYMPEPWWGWTPLTREPLHSVCINLKPGAGGKLQKETCIRCSFSQNGVGSYSEAMAKGALQLHLEPTERWHHDKRYVKIMEALDVPNDRIPSSTMHHLSIELCPFHQVESLDKYIKENAEDVFEQAIMFAAEAATLIEPPFHSQGTLSLKNIVLVRAATSYFATLKEALKGTKNDEMFNVDHLKSQGVFRVQLPDGSSVTFICLQGVRNNFPSIFFLE